jgi:hypothetical protein
MIGRAQTKLPDLKVDRVWLAGGGASLKGLDAYLKQAMGVPVERFDPFSACDLSELSEEERTAVQAAPHEYAVALGLAQTPLAPAAFPLAVVPEAMRKKRDFATKGVFAVAAAAVAAAALFVLYSSRQEASAATASQGKSLKAVEDRMGSDDKAFREALASLQEVRAKHRILSEIAAPGPLYAESVALLQSRLADHPEVYLESVTLSVEDQARTYRRLHPPVGTGAAYQEREHTHTVRGATVRVVGLVSPGPSPEKAFNDFVQAVRGNDRRLVVTTRKTFQSRDGRFELEIAPGVSFRPKGTEASYVPWVLRGATFVTGADGQPEAITGADVEGVPVTVPKDRVEPDDWKRLVETLPPPVKAEPAPGK